MKVVFRLLIASVCPIVASSVLAQSEEGGTVSVQLYDSAEESVAPLTPDEIKRFRKSYEERREAQEAPLVTYTPVNRHVRLDLSPGSKIESIRLAPDHTTNVTFLDRNGEPWPIDTARAGNDSIVQVEQNIDHVASLTLGRKYRPTNLTVTLVGLESPLIFLLASGGTEVDYGRTFILPRSHGGLDVASGEGEGGSPSRRGGGIDVPDWNDDVMSAFLDGIPPEDATEVPTDGGAEARVWHFNGALYVVTKREMHFPSVGMPLHGTNDWKVYEVPGVNLDSSRQPILTLVRDDNTVHVTVLTEMVQ